MTQEQGNTAVTTSALMVAGIYAYRKLTEHVAQPTTVEKPTTKQIASGFIGTGELLPVGPWVTGFGVTFIVLAILNSASPDIGGMAAILVATGCVLGNGSALFDDLKKSTATAKIPGLFRPGGLSKSSPAPAVASSTAVGHTSALEPVLA